MTKPDYISEDGTVRLYHADCRDAMRAMEAESVHAIVTDPPYGLSFMGKGWDHGVPGEEFWIEALRVAKPGAHLLAFGGTRTFHRLTCAIEDAGWEIRDCIQWVYGSGFPKSKNLAGKWKGWGTALKPAWEPIIVARKPLRGTVAANVEAHGCGALNVDGCRVGYDGPEDAAAAAAAAELRGKIQTRNTDGWGMNAQTVDRTEYLSGSAGLGRWPANVVHDGSDEVLEGFGDDHEAARFFYCAKASREDREAGLEASGLEVESVRTGCSGEMPTDDDGNARDRFLKRARNIHPTVKPNALMRYLCRLVTPPGGIVLDPFMGSGSTGVAAIQEGFRFAGVDVEAQYFKIAEARIRAFGAQTNLLSETP